MMTTKDYYETLGVSKDASQDEIKRAFRKKARDLHPDVNKASDAEDRFKELGQAYEVLMDSEKREMYDRYGEDGLRNAGYDFEGPFDFGFGDLNDIFSAFFGSGMGGSSHRRANSPARGSDLRVDLEITFEEAAFGTEKDLEIQHLETCKVCSGSGNEPGHSYTTCQTCKGAGQVQHTTQTILGHFTQVSTCPKCHGQGRIVSHPCKSCSGQGRKEVSKAINVKIPKGVDNRNKLRVNSEGDAGKNGGPSGDLYVVLFIKPHKTFKRDEINIYSEHYISFSQAALGDELKVETVDGPKTIKISAGTQTGTVSTIKGAGVPMLNNPSRRGNHYVKFVVITPVGLNEEERKLFQRLEEIQEKKGSKDSFINKIKGAFSGSSS